MNAVATADRPWLGAYPAGVPADIDVNQYASLVQLLEESFQKYAARPAYSFMGKEVTFGQTDGLSASLAAYLQSLGGSTTVTMQTHLPYHAGGAAAAEAPAP